MDSSSIYYDAGPVNGNLRFNTEYVEFDNEELSEDQSESKDMYLNEDDITNIDGYELLASNCFSISFSDSNKLELILSNISSKNKSLLNNFKRLLDSKDEKSLKSSILIIFI